MIFFVAFAWGEEDGADLIQSALTRAGDNAVQLRRALEEVPVEQREGMRFLIAHMPERDLCGLSADFLLKNVRVAYQAWNEAPWKDRISKAMFLNEVLPYASINERRDDWREDFFTRFRPLVANANSPSAAAAILNQKIFRMLKVRFSRGRRKADQSPLETIEAGTASCTGLSVLLVDACRAVGIPARFVGTPLWADRQGNHSWVEIWDGDWHYMGAAEPTGDQLDRAWFSGRATTAKRDHRLHAIYATSFQQTGITFPLVWDRQANYVHAVNVTDRYAKPAEQTTSASPLAKNTSNLDVEASIHAVSDLKEFLQADLAERPPLAQQEFVNVNLTREDSREAERLLWKDHVKTIKATRAAEMKAKSLTIGDLQMPFFFKVSGDKRKHGRSMFISLHGGGGAPKQVNDGQWRNQQRLYEVTEGVYVAPRAPSNTWNLWHQGHIDHFFDRLIENMIVFEDVDPNRVYVLGYSAGGDGVYQLAPRMADRFAAAAMMAGHPNEASPLGLRNLPFTIHVGAEDAGYNRNKVAEQWGEKLDGLRKDDPDGYIHWTKIYEGKGHWLDREDAAALPWMAKYSRQPLPKRIVWRQDDVTHARFYWLAVNPEAQRKGVEVRASREGQAFDVNTRDVKQLIIRVNDQMLDLEKAITVSANGEIVFDDHCRRTIAMLAKSLDERGDPASVFCSEIVVTIP